MQIDHRSGLVRAGETMAIVKAGQQHGFAAQGENRFLVLDLALPQQQLALEKQPSFLPLHKGLLGYVQCLDYQLGFSLDSASGKSKTSAALTPGLQLQMSEVLLGLLPGGVVSTGFSNSRERVERVRQWLDNNYMQPLDMKVLAATVSWSVRQLSGRFHELTGQSVRDYHQQVRMFHAARLLEQTGLPIQTIAERVGYADLSSFSYRFRQSQGMSPRQWRVASKTPTAL